MTEIDSFSKDIWAELRRRGLHTPKEKEAAHKRFIQYRKQYIKEKWPICCEFWKGIYVQKEVRHLVRRITKQNEAYSEKLRYCPECGEKL